MTPTLPLIAAVLLVAGPVGAPPAGPASALGDGQALMRAERTSLSSTPAPAAGVVQHVAARTAADRRRVLDYWTPQRMARALPAGVLGSVGKLGDLASGGLPLRLASALPPAAPRPVAPGRPARPARPVHPPRHIHPARPTSSPSTSSTVSPASPASPASPPPVPPSRASLASAPHVSTSGARWAAGGAVTRTTGRVFLTLRGVDYVCSAGAVKSQNMDVVVTAGHCVKDGVGAWAENWTFVPGYESGHRPYGVFTARRMSVPERWSENGDDSYDLGMVAVDPSGRRHLNEAVGGQEIGFNTPRGTRAFGFGFPADPPYDGEHLIYCAGGLHGDPHNQTHDQGMRCDLTAGSSGGPWLSSFDPATGQGVVTSVSSFKYSDDGSTMYGPYFGDQARQLFEAAQRS